MNRWFYIALAILTCAGCNPNGRNATSNKTENPPEPTVRTAPTMSQPHPEPKPDPAEGMKKLRLRTLNATPGDFGIQSTKEFPQVYGVLVEIPMSEVTITVVSLCDGNASLYTTGTFGVIGGYAHETVRSAAMACVRAAQGYHDEATTTKDFAYPKSDRVRFYLLTFTGVRVIETDLASLESGKNKYFGLFSKGNDVITELRKITMK